MGEDASSTRKAGFEGLNGITEEIIGAAIQVHRVLGPGLLESAYETCLAYELSERGMGVVRQKALPVVYRDVTLDAGYRLDLLVDQEVIVELKSVDHLEKLHEAQLLSYLKLSGLEVGILNQLQCQNAQTGPPKEGQLTLSFSVFSVFSVVNPRREG